MRHALALRFEVLDNAFFIPTNVFSYCAARRGAKRFPEGGPEADEVPGRDPFGGGHERAVEDIHRAQVAVTILIRVILFI